MGRLDEIAVAAKPGVTSQQLLEEIRPILPSNAQAVTGLQQAEEDASETNEFIGFLQGFLLAFGGIALFVGSFVIANSLSITIAQRIREFATLRTIGASRRQILTSVILESFVVGVLASVVGLFLGLLLAKGLFELFDAVGFTLPNVGLLFETRTVIVALLAGILVTVLASLRPAIRATRVPPIAAVREGATLPEARHKRLRTAGALLTIVAGFAALLYGLFGPDLGTTQILIWMGLGALLVFLGVALFSSRLVRPLARLLGWPATKIGGTAGTLARDNSQRNPQRTASTASALMIGLALVTLVATLAAGIVNSFEGAVNDLFTGDYAITAQNNFSPIPTAASEAVEGVPGVTAVGNVRTGEARIFGSTEFATAVDPGMREVISMDWVAGSQDTLADLGADGAFTDDGYAKDHDLTVGSPVQVTFPSGATKTFTIKGIFDPPSGGSPFGVVTISADTWDKEVDRPKNLYSFVKMTGGETEANQAALDTALADFPNAKAQDRQSFIDNQISGLSSILNILYVLLALSVLVEPLRDREHARADRLRAHARDRDASRDRDDPPSGAADDPPRERHHVTDRRHARDRARARPRRSADRPRRLHRVHVPDHPGDRLRDRRDPGRRARGDLPRPPGGEAQPARGPALRVRTWGKPCFPHEPPSSPNWHCDRSLASRPAEPASGRHRCRTHTRQPPSRGVDPLGYACGGGWPCGRRATPSSCAARATAAATAGATSRLKTLGTTYSAPSSSCGMTAASACAAATFIPSVIREARTSSAPRKTPGNASTLLIWFG